MIFMDVVCVVYKVKPFSIYGNVRGGFIRKSIVDTDLIRFWVGGILGLVGDNPSERSLPSLNTDSHHSLLVIVAVFFLLTLFLHLLRFPHFFSDLLVLRKHTVDLDVGLFPI